MTCELFEVSTIKRTPVISVLAYFTPGARPLGPVLSPDRLHSSALLLLWPSLSPFAVHVLCPTRSLLLPVLTTSVTLTLHSPNLEPSLDHAAPRRLRNVIVGLVYYSRINRRSPFAKRPWSFALFAPAIVRRALDSYAEQSQTQGPRF